MQPQDSGFEWMHAASGAIGAIFGVGSAIVAWVVKAARMEPLMRAEIVAAEKRAEEKVEGIVSQFQETFSAIRQQINNQALELERDFMRKRDYEALRKEDRDAFDRFQNRYFKEFDDLKNSIAAIVGRKN